MVIAAALYASIEMKKIDIWYSDLIGKDVKALQNLTVARALSGNSISFFIRVPSLTLTEYVIDANIDKTVAEFHSAVGET